MQVGANVQEFVVNEKLLLPILKALFQDCWIYKYQYPSYIYVYLTSSNHMHSGLEYEYRFTE
jgi:hypothetical protein